MTRLVFALFFSVALATVACSDPGSPSPNKDVFLPPTVPVLPLISAEANLATAKATGNAGGDKAEAADSVRLYEVSSELNSLPLPIDKSLVGDLTWQETVGLALKYFVSEPQTYDDGPQARLSEFGDIPEVRRRLRDHTREVMVAYGIFQLGNSPMDNKYLGQAVRLLWSSPESRELAYRLTVPSIKKALASMNAKDRRDYLAILDHAWVYMTTFNVDRETLYLHSLAHEECYRENEKWEKQYYRLPTYMSTEDSYPCTILFTDYGPDGRRNPYRKVEAFIFRRVAAGWKIEEMRAVLHRLILDLS